MATYDPKITAAMTDRLYDKAANVVGANTMLGALIGVLLGGALGGFLLRTGQAGLIGAALLGVLFGAVGYSIGTNAALILRFQAQQALVLTEIEKNTRARV